MTRAINCSSPVSYRQCIADQSEVFLDPYVNSNNTDLARMYTYLRAFFSSSYRLLVITLVKLIARLSLNLLLNNVVAFLSKSRKFIMSRPQTK